MRTKQFQNILKLFLLVMSSKIGFKAFKTKGIGAFEVITCSLKTFYNHMRPQNYTVNAL
jgi:hypothetical protein